jgi:hypothetical protein
MAVLNVVQPLPPAGNPEVDSLIANYSLYIDGQLIGTTPNADMIQGTCCIIEFFDHEHGIGGSEYRADGEHFRGQMALTRLSLGTLSVEQSLYFTGNNGDYNRDGSINAADYVMWRKMSGASVAQGALADGTGNGTIDQDDYNYWRSRFGSGVGSGTGQQSPIAAPEPSSATVWLLGYLLIKRMATIRCRKAD